MKKLLAILVLATLFLVGCGDENPMDSKKVNDEFDTSEYQFEEVKINGMRCVILVNDTSHGYDVVTFDCDWDSKEEN